MDSFTSYDIKCKDTQGGIKRAYLLPYVEYNEILVQSVAMTLTVFPSSTVYKYECEGNYTQTSQQEKGAISWNHTVNLQLSKMYGLDLDINAFLRNDWRVIVETNNNQLIIFGVDNGMVCNSSNATGTNKNEFNGFEITFTGKEDKAGLLIDELGDFFTVYSPYVTPKFGLLYNYYAYTDVREITPAGWHVGTYTEYDNLVQYAADNYVSATNNDGGLHLNENDSDYWSFLPVGRDNALNFNGRGAGYRNHVGDFNAPKQELYLASTSDGGTGCGLGDICYIGPIFGGYSDDRVRTVNYSGKRYGVSLRPIKDTPTAAELALTDGATADPYIGNDGKFYSTVKIGSNVYVSANLIETKYRNGDYIAGWDSGTYTPISDATWTGLLTGALCAFNDDLDNV